MRPEHWIVAAIALGTCVPALVQQILHLRANLPRSVDAAAPPVDRIDAQNRIFGAVIGISLTTFGISAVLYFMAGCLRG